MPSIKVKENEPFEVAMRRFKRAIEKTGLLTELRAREAYEKTTTERKRKKDAAAKSSQKSRCSKTFAKTPAQPTVAAKIVLILRPRIRQPENIHSRIAAAP